MIKGIWAQTYDGLIGNKGKLPWNLPDEMRHFINTTMEHIVVMGRKTWEGIGKKPLPYRVNIVLSSQELDLPDGVYLAHSVEEVISIYEAIGDRHLFVIGGKEVYEAFIPYYDEVIVSYVKDNYVGDCYLTGWLSRFNPVKAFHSVTYDTFKICYYEVKK